MFWSIVNRRNIYLSIVLLLLGCIVSLYTSNLYYRQQLNKANLKIGQLQQTIKERDISITHLAEQVDTLKLNLKVLDQAVSQTESLLEKTREDHDKIKFQLGEDTRKLYLDSSNFLDSYNLEKDHLKNYNWIDGLKPEAIDSLSTKRIEAMWSGYCLGFSCEEK